MNLLFTSLVKITQEEKTQNTHRSAASPTLPRATTRKRRSSPTLSLVGTQVLTASQAVYKAKLDVKVQNTHYLILFKIIKFKIL